MYKALFFLLVLFLYRLVLIVISVIRALTCLPERKSIEIVLIKTYTALIGVGVLVVIEKLTALAVSYLLFGFHYLITTKSGIPFTYSG